MNPTRLLAPLALTLILCPAFADGLNSVPAPPHVRQLGVQQGELIGHELRSANVFQKAQLLTAIEFGYDRGLTIGLLQTTPDVLQVAIGMVTPDKGTLSVSLFSELSNGQVVGVTLNQANVPDAAPLQSLSPAKVRQILSAFEQVAGGGQSDGGKLVAASVDWRATDTEHSVGATLLQQTASTQGTFDVYAQLFRTSFSFATGYEVRTRANGDMQARRDATGEPHGINHVECRTDSRGGGVVVLGYDTRNARALEAHLRAVLLAVEETQAAEALRRPSKGASIVVVAPGQEVGEAVIDALQGASK